jgi:hypothetical protein
VNAFRLLLRIGSFLAFIFFLIFHILCSVSLRIAIDCCWRIKDNKAVGNNVGVADEFDFLDVPRLPLTDDCIAFATQILMIVNDNHKVLELQIPLNESNNAASFDGFPKPANKVCVPISDQLVGQNLRDHW